MAITQTYNRGVDFNAYTWTDVSAGWEWEGRTLSGFRKADGAFVAPGGVLNYEAEAASISGVWTRLDTRFPMDVRLVGASGGVTVRVTERNVSAPLGSPSHPYVKTYEMAQTATCPGIKYQSAAEGSLSVDVLPRSGTVVRSVSLGGVSYPVGQQIVVQGWDDFASGGRNVLCVDFTGEGVLTYYSNKGYAVRRGI